MNEYRLSDIELLEEEIEEIEMIISLEEIEREDKEIIDLISRS